MGRWISSLLRLTNLWVCCSTEVRRSIYLLCQKYDAVGIRYAKFMQNIYHFKDVPKKMQLDIKAELTMKGSNNRNYLCSPPPSGAPGRGSMPPSPCYSSEDLISCQLTRSVQCAHQKPITVLRAAAGRVVTGSQDHTVRVTPNNLNTY